MTSYSNGFGDVRLMYRLVLAVDVEKYTAKPSREQLRVQVALRAILHEAAQDVGLDQRDWYEQVSGDGELIVLPEDVDVSVVVGDFTRRIEVALGEFNRYRDGNARLRLRMAMHHGTLTPGPFGPAGDAPICVSRLLGATPLRRLLTEQQDRDLALIVSQSLYQDVIRTGFCSLDPVDFRPVRVNVKGVQYYGFVQTRDIWESSSLGAPAVLRIRSMADSASVAAAMKRAKVNDADNEQDRDLKGTVDDGRRFNNWVVSA
ncbi:hypothetical protein [Actinoallomurus sp. CA-142502]|uniref:hypothetical protein n=1 Tax=Actinoallomurus sp. CA-142502 TaxID=3239885 RepID=UPI003D92D7E1